jgi:hypothetical protein
MADSGSSAHEPPSSAAQPGAERRKLRKGTRSCWECKRRKNRCTWSTDEGKCDGCHHRGTRCMGQEFPEERVLHQRRRTNKSEDIRLRRLEELVEQLARRVDPEGVYKDHTQSPPDDGRDEAHAPSRSSPSPNEAITSFESSASSDIPDSCSHVPRNNPSVCPFSLSPLTHILNI